MDVDSSSSSSSSVSAEVLTRGAALGLAAVTAGYERARRAEGSNSANTCMPGWRSSRMHPLVPHRS